MTNQEAFDIMVTHLRKQGCKSEDEQHETCLYRGPNGLKCAVGALIPDEEYKPEWDEKGTAAGRLDCAALRGIEGGLLYAMQQAHDHSPVRWWEEKFQEIADTYHLTIPPMEVSHA